GINPVITVDTDDNLNTLQWQTAAFGQTNTVSQGDGVLIEASNASADPVEADIIIVFDSTVYNLAFDLGDLDAGNAEEVAVIAAFLRDAPANVQADNFSANGSSVDIVGNSQVQSNGTSTAANSSNTGSVRIALPGPLDSLRIRASGSLNDLSLHLNHVEYCLAPDTDGDGLADLVDLDADNDGIPDLIEAGGSDVNGDGKVDLVEDGGTFYVDEDGDGVKDPGETTVWDSDGDGWLDTFDNVGGGFTGGSPIIIPDQDGDNIPDHLDLDADNDGITDALESGAVDNDGDGRADDFVDNDLDGLNDQYDPVDGDPEAGNDADFTSSANAPTLQTNLDTDGDGLSDEGLSVGDSDGDGLADHVDLDADNDGIPDVIEVGGVDTDGDGKVDGSNPDGSLANDIDGDGLADAVDPDLNNDGDSTDPGDTGLPIAISDTDADNDGRPDAYGSFDNDNDGATPVISIDADGDGIPNFKDLDSDNDGIPDRVEVGGVDADGNGIVDAVDGNGVFTAGNDDDNDGFYDSYDPDDNGTGADEALTSNPLLLSVGSGSGTNNGHPALADYSGNTNLNNGLNADFDGDGIPNYLDLDADNDGISDVVETFGIAEDMNLDGAVDGLNANDANANGWHDNFEGEVPTSTDISGTEFSSNTLPDYSTGQDEADFDGDGLPNYLDIDADNDGIVDVLEAQVSSTNPSDIFDGIIVPGTTDQDYDGLADVVDQDHAGTYLQPNNHDGTGNADFLDLDADDDGKPDTREGHDSNLDGIPDNSASGTDTDRDGLDDAYDTDNLAYDPTASNQSLQDEDGDVNSSGDRDWRDTDFTTFPVEWLNVGVEKQGSQARIYWSTASELNADHFVVERSEDARNFTPLGQLAAKGTTTERSDYRFIDPTIEEKRRFYYRIQQVDIDGSIDYSNVVELRAESLSLSATVYPNPARDQVNLSFYQEGQSEIKVINMQGQTMYETLTENKKGNLDITVALKGWAAGVYVVQINRNGEMEDIRLIVE
ncbi:MAG: T9SS type A sorting domain-containing protein, partial [Bacteroidota bacterium]